MAQRTCEVCTAAFEAKMLSQVYCSVACRRRQGRLNEYRLVTCVMCDTQWSTLRARARFCSYVCRDVWRLDQPDDPMYSALFRPRSPRQPKVCRLPKDHPAMWCGQFSPIAFGACGWCGAMTCRGHDGTRAYCSTKCKNKAKNCRRRGRVTQGFGYWSWSDFMHVARRFGYRCAYCGVKPTDYSRTMWSLSASVGLTRSPTSCPHVSSATQTRET